MTTRYLNPKNDLIFKKIFGQHPDILKSFLNAILPLPEGREIIELDYLPAEQVPVIPAFKNTIADVKCKDQTGDIFVVETRIEWTASFVECLLHGVNESYIKPHREKSHEGLNHILGVGLIDDVLEEDTEKCCHHYQFSCNTSSKILEDMQLLLIELPKLKAQLLASKRMQAWWLHFMSDLNEETTEVPKEWLEVPEIQEALTLAQETSYTPEELDSYHTYRNAVPKDYKSGLFLQIRSREPIKYLRV